MKSREIADQKIILSSWKLRRIIALKYNATDSVPKLTYCPIP